MRDAIANTFNELPLARYASVVSWYATLTWVTSTLKCYHGIPELCIKLLTEISQEMNKRWDPYGALLGTRLVNLDNMLLAITARERFITDLVFTAFLLNRKYLITI